MTDTVIENRIRKAAPAKPVARGYMRTGMPDRPGLWVDRNGDLWLCDRTNGLPVRGGKTWRTHATARALFDLKPYAPFRPANVE